MPSTIAPRVYVGPDMRLHVRRLKIRSVQLQNMRSAIIVTGWDQIEYYCAAAGARSGRFNEAATIQLRK